ncbi:MAG: protein-glutamate O-methyltransferase CheR [Thermodesulfobacteriota bacterium]
MSMFEDSHEQELLASVIDLAQQWSGCNFLRYNPSTMRRRVARRMIDVRCQSLAQYLDYLTAHPGEYPHLVACLTIKVSCFFRDPAMFALLEAKVLPQLLRRAQAAGRRHWRVWSAACAGGEEAYSLAILLAGQETSLAVSILATDLDPDILASAARGVYPAAALELVAEHRRQQFFVPVGGENSGAWQVVPQLRAMVDFVSFDLTSTARLSPPSGIFAEYDLILCRNMLIYCQPDLKREIIARLHACLSPEGCLVLGRAESMPEPLGSRFVPFDQRFKIFIKKETVA